MTNNLNTESSYQKNFILRHNLQWLIIAMIILAVDQVSKYLIGINYLLDQAVPVTSFFNIFFTYNTGAAFSFLAKANGWQEWLFGGIAAFISLAIIYWLYSAPPGRKLAKFSLMLILGGATGNLIDRAIYGHVRDFLDFYWNNFSLLSYNHFPAFNFADSAVCVGAMFLIIEVFRRDY